MLYARTTNRNADIINFLHKYTYMRTALLGSLWLIEELAMMICMGRGEGGNCRIGRKGKIEGVMDKGCLDG